MAAALPAVPSCKYDAPIAPIAPADLKHEGFCFPPSSFTHRNRMFFKANDQYFDTTPPFKQFSPERYYKNQRELDAFVAHANNPANLMPLTDAIFSMFAISQQPGIECASFRRMNHTFQMFCSPEPDIESNIRMKLFCAYGMLNNFVNHSKVELLVRGGLALRLQLHPKSLLISTASVSDMDGLIVVDRSMSPDDLNAFKTTFMRLLILSIKHSIPHGVEVICAPAGGDKDTIKIKLKIPIIGTREMGDFGFKYLDDEIVEIYKEPVDVHDPSSRTIRQIDGIFQMKFPMYHGFMQCVWNFPHIKNMEKEYERVHGNLMSQSRERHIFDEDYEALEPAEKSLIKKFKQKREISSGKYGGKKKRTMKRRTRGGSTTEQIGTAAQMRAFLPRHSITRNALNHIVHHEEVQNKYHDPTYRYDHGAQAVINSAFQLINGNPNISRRTKKQMKIARKKSLTAK